MTVLDVYLNDRKLCRAGVGRDGVLTAIVNWVKLTGEATGGLHGPWPPGQEARLQVAGLRKNTHMAWAERSLEVGDRVSVVLARSDAADPPVRQQRRDPKQEKRMQRAYYLRLKKQFEPPGSATQFLNIDLDIWSASPLEPLVKAFGRKVLILRVGKERRGYGAHLELAAQSDKPDVVLRRFVRLVEELPRSARTLWNRARVREFNIGIQSAPKPYSFELTLKDATVRAVAGVHARIGMTVYGQ